MKKTLALVLSLLVAFSMFAVAASAEEATVDPATVVTYQFKKNGVLLGSFAVAPGTKINPDMVPDVEDEYFTEKTDENGDIVKLKHTFKGWALVENGEVTDDLDYSSTIPTPGDDMLGKTVVYEAQYSVEDYSERQSFWNLVESIFERINKIFEYFALIFKW